MVSSSVLEHVGDVEGLARAMQQLMAPGALAVHFIDLRDHFFKFPFEMLCYSERIWRTFLNAGNNLNRLRVAEHRQTFEKYFSHVDITVLERLEEPWRQVESRVRPEIKTGDPEIDALSQMLLLASSQVAS